MHKCPDLMLHHCKRGHVHHLKNKHITVRSIIIMAFKHMAIHLHSMSVCPSASVWVLELVLKWGRPCGNTPAGGWEKTIAPVSVRLFISDCICYLAYAVNHKRLTLCWQTKSISCILIWAVLLICHNSPLLTVISYRFLQSTAVYRVYI